jgi:hypothetical protein
MLFWDSRCLAQESRNLGEWQPANIPHDDAERREAGTPGTNEMTAVQILATFRFAVLWAGASADNHFASGCRDGARSGECGSEISARLAFRSGRRSRKADLQTDRTHGLYNGDALLPYTQPVAELQ